MARSLFSPSWHNVAELRPRLAPHARMERHVYRGRIWYIVHEQGGGRFHRLSPATHAFLMKMDGHRTVQALWEDATAGGGDEAFTQGEVVDLLVQLHAADLLQVDVPPDAAALFQRYRKKKFELLKQWLLNPLSLKLPLLNPDPFLLRWLPRLRWCFGRAGAALWLLVVVPALVLAVQHWRELTGNMSDQVLSSSNLLVMAVVFPVVKLLHELGHGFAARAWGGAVPQMGLMFLVFAPAPYVDASSSSAFPSKYRRAVVAAAGMLVEVFVAALAMYVWLLAEPGLVRAVAYNTLIVAGVSTLVVNGNPLLRYDAYYIFADLIEMPNLAQRGQKYLAWLWDYHVFGARDLEPPQESPAERRWLLAYTPLAWCYRTLVSIGLILFIGSKFFFFGALLAAWSAFSLVVLPLWKAWRHVVASPGLQRRRTQAVRISLALVGGLLLLAFAVPAPLHTRADGVVWLPDAALLHAGGDGFFRRWLVAPGSRVRRGDPLYELEDRELAAEAESSRARVEEAEATYRSQQFSDPVKAGVSLQTLEHEREVLRRAEERQARLVGRAEVDGVVVAPQPQDMPGRYFRKGDLVGYVVNGQQLLARVVVTQEDIYLVRTRFRSADLRLAEAPAATYRVTSARLDAGGVQQLPSAALSLHNGGRIATAPDDPEGLKTMERVFTLDLALPEAARSSAFGARVHVRFNHGYEPLGIQGLRRLRQVFLSHFSV